MEKAWPPLSECYQFKIGLMHAALRRYPWEDDKYAFDFNSYYPPIPDELACLRKLLDSLRKNNFRRSYPEDIRNCPFCRLHPNPQDPIPSVSGIKTLPAWRIDRIPVDADILKDPVWDMDPIPCPFHLSEHVWPHWDSPRPGLVTPIQLDDTKKYLNQVRNSRGYDVDCVPDGVLVVPEFWDFDLNDEVGRDMKDIMMRKLGSSAIAHINMKTNKVYELEDILKIVSTRRSVYLVTFTAKVKNDDSAACETFIATIILPAGIVKECLLKPGYDAPGPDHYPDYVLHPIHVPNFFMRRKIAVPAHVGPFPLLGSEKRSSAAVPAHVVHVEAQDIPSPLI